MFVAGMSLSGAPQARSGEPGVNPSPLRGELLREPVRLQVNIEPGFDSGGEIKLVCTRRTYQGECSRKKGDSTLRMAISGAIKKMNRGSFLISYDLEVQVGERSGMTRFSAAGSGRLLSGKPTRIVTIGGRSVIMTATTPISDFGLRISDRAFCNPQSAFRSGFSDDKREMLRFGGAGEISMISLREGDVK